MASRIIARGAENDQAMQRQQEQIGRLNGSGTDNGQSAYEKAREVDRMLGRSSSSGAGAIVPVLNSGRDDRYQGWAQSGLDEHEFNGSDELTQPYDGLGDTTRHHGASWRQGSMDEEHAFNAKDSIDHSTYTSGDSFYNEPSSSSVLAAHGNGDANRRDHDGARTVKGVFPSDTSWMATTDFEENFGRSYDMDYTGAEESAYISGGSPERMGNDTEAGFDKSITFNTLSSSQAVHYGARNLSDTVEEINAPPGKMTFHLRYHERKGCGCILQLQVTCC